MRATGCGFNGKENDNEVKGEGAQYDYGFRIYDPRLGRFLSTDPLSAKYPWYSSYQFAGNKPIQCIDLDGAEERIPYAQSEAFDKISNPPFNDSYIRGKRGEAVASTLPDERSEFQKFIASINPIQITPIRPASHVAQAINFAKSVGSVAYDFNAYQVGKTIGISNNSEAINAGARTVYVSISGYSEVGKAIIENLRATHGLKELSDVEISDYISGVKILFNSGTDYSYLFWLQVDGNQKPEMQLSQIGAPAIPLSPPTPLVLPVGVSVSGINLKNGNIVVSTEAISQEMAETLAPSLIQMAHKEKLSQSTGSTKKGGAKETRHSHGQQHGSVKSKKGNKQNPNQRKGAKDRGGKLK